MTDYTMSKYIDSEKLIAEIEWRKNRIERRIDNIAPLKRKDTIDEEQLVKIELRDKVDKAYLNGVWITLSDILSFITHLQQERGPHTESWIETTKKELQHEEELLDMRLETLKRIREKKSQFQQEQLSNLDEAAQKVEDYYDVDEEHGYLCCHRGDIKDAFKAGAEWMARQGETFNGFISVKGKRSLIAIVGSSQNFKFGEDVIVQIRKKQ